MKKTTFRNDRRLVYSNRFFICEFELFFISWTLSMLLFLRKSFIRPAFRLVFSTLFIMLLKLVCFYLSFDLNVGWDV